MNRGSITLSGLQRVVLADFTRKAETVIAATGASKQIARISNRVQEMTNETSNSAKKSLRGRFRDNMSASSYLAENI